MKILLDPVLTAESSRCSTMIQFYTLVKYVLEDLKRDDVFFYWRVPKHVGEEEFQWYPQHPNIKYVRYEAHRVDRVQEYLHFSPELERDVDFWGELWDYDVVITVRTPLVPLMKLRMTSPRQHHRTYMKEVWLIEEMPLMEFKGTVPVMDAPVQDHLVLQGHLAADKVFLVSYHEQVGIFDAARKYLSASMQKALRDKIQHVVTTQFSNFSLKKKAFFTEPKPFTMAFVGRMEKVQAQLEKVNELMVRQWITKGDKVQLLACTASKAVKCFDQDLVEVGSFPRKEFWRRMQEDVHVVVTLGKEMGFSLSLLEPLMLGTPAIVLKRDYVVPLLGENYPFYISGPGEAPGMVEMFYRNYPTCYERFMKWYHEFLMPKYQERFKTDLLYSKLVREMDRYEAGMQAHLDEEPQRKDNGIVQLIAQHVEGKQEFVLSEVIRELGQQGHLDHLAKKLEPEFMEGASLPWLPTWNEHRTTIKYQLNWEDASTTVGHLRRKKGV